ncbi:MAG: hypothetical protein DRP64_14775, partial [Verrucomicrobia bacterium]
MLNAGSFFYLPCTPDFGGNFGFGRLIRPLCIRLRRIADASAESLEEAITETVEPGTLIKTDGWNGYNGVEALGYEHKVIRKTADVGDNLLPLCHREASLIKRWLGG